MCGKGGSLSLCGVDLSERKNKMAVYLVDFENVSSGGLSGVQQLTKDDTVYIFYTANAANMSFAAHLNLLSSPAEVIYYNVSSGGKNALDFQLSSFLGFLICNRKSNDYYIISNDNGYEYVKKFWERSEFAKGVVIHSAPSIKRAFTSPENVFSSKIKQVETLGSDKPALKEQTSSSETDSIQSVPAQEIAKAPKKRGRPRKKPAEDHEEQKPEDALAAAVGGLLNNIGIDSETEISVISERLRGSKDKQQFYRNLISLYGMEKGVEVYRSIKSDYSMLMKLV